MMTSDLLDEKRSASFGRLVTRIAARIQKDLATRPDQDLALSASQKSVLIQLEARGNSATSLALRLGISKQATSKLVQDLEQKELVFRQTDPDDGRSSIIQFTQKGRNIVQDTVQYFENLESKISDELGKEDLQLTKEKIAAIAGFLDPHGF
ncbi:MAG: MarR family transcriptional regulator [Sneathiella sp.]